MWSVVRSTDDEDDAATVAGVLTCTLHWFCQQRDVVQVKTARAAVTGGWVGFGRPRTDADGAGAAAGGIAAATGVARTGREVMKRPAVLAPEKNASAST